MELVVEQFGAVMLIGMALWFAVTWLLEYLGLKEPPMRRHDPYEDHIMRMDMARDLRFHGDHADRHDTD